MKSFIEEGMSLGLWNVLDVQFATMLENSVFSSNVYDNQQNIKRSALILASMCLSASIRLGHTCFPMHLLASKEFFQKHYYKLVNKNAIQKIRNLSIDDWQELLLSLPAVGDGSYVSPLVLEDQYLYLHRIWKDEYIVAQFLSCRHNNLKNTQKEKIINILNTLFSNTLLTKNNEHKTAITLGLIHPKVFISGGPGTGKTSIVSAIITALLLYNNNLRIKIAAPTGKAAAILTDSCNSVLSNFTKCDNFDSYKLMLQATTLHNLLGIRLYKKENEYGSLNILDLDVLIIDEASMIGLSILAQLISSLPNLTKIIFLGDQYQLCSIHPGSVFKDICRFSNFSYSTQRQQELIELIGYVVPNNHHHNNNKYYNHNIIDGTCILKKNYRFQDNSGISQLAKAIHSGNYSQAISVLTSKIYTDLFYTPILEKKSYYIMIMNCALKYCNYLKKLQNNSKKLSIITLLQLFNEHQILCALRHGPFGVIQLNRYIEQILNNQGLITLNNSGNYLGKPIIVLHTDLSTGLHNGDIGILLPNTQNKLSAYFLLSKRKIKTIPIYQLPEYETCFVMTIHKSQGSSFQDVSIILPNTHLPILTRELLYTAVTRARQQLFLYATNDVITRSVNLVQQRYSRLYEKIEKFSVTSFN